MKGQKSSAQKRSGIPIASQLKRHGNTTAETTATDRRPSKKTTDTTATPSVAFRLNSTTPTTTAENNKLLSSAQEGKQIILGPTHTVVTPLKQRKQQTNSGSSLKAPPPPPQLGPLESSYTNSSELYTSTSTTTSAPTAGHRAQQLWQLQQQLRHQIREKEVQQQRLSPCVLDPMDVSMATSMGAELGSELHDYELPLDNEATYNFDTNHNMDTSTTGIWHQTGGGSAHHHGARRMSNMARSMRKRAASTFSLAASSDVNQLQQWEKRFVSAKEVFADFAARTSAHGMPHIAESYTFWLIVFSFCATAFAIQTYWTVDIYLSYKTTVEMQLLFEAAPFPAVTICNLNPYKAELVKNYPEIHQAIMSYENEVTNANPRVVNARFKRQIVYTPIFAKCLCAHPLHGCVPLREIDDYNNQNATSCMCYQDKDRPENMWPCYPKSAWNKTTCSGCRPTGICDHPTRHDRFWHSQRYEQSCYCQFVSNVCLRYESDHEPPWWDPFDFKTVTIPPKPDASTLSPDVLDALGAGDSDKQDKSSITTQAKENVISIVTAMPDELRMNLSHQAEDFIRRCSFNGIDCNRTTQFRIHLDPEYGSCFTFNWNNTAVVKNSRAGPMYGLRLLLDVDQASYLPFTEAAGVRLVVHDQSDEAFPDTFGYSAPVGFVSSFGLKTKVVERMAPPYGNCTPKFRPEGYIYDEEYSTEGCYRNCFQHRVLENCGCGDPRFPVPTGEHTCYLYDRNQRDCLRRFQAEMGTFHRMQEGCGCKQPCREVVFETAYAAAAWPADNFVTGDCPEWVNSTVECTEYFRKNTAYIEVYYEQLNFERLRETEAYTVINLLADFGGNIGLWIGFSVITFIELIELMMEMLYLCYFRGKREEEKRQRKRMRVRLRNHMQHFSRFADMAQLAAEMRRESVSQQSLTLPLGELPAPSSSLYRGEDSRGARRTTSDANEKLRMLEMMDLYDEEGNFVGD